MIDGLKDYFCFDLKFLVYNLINRNLKIRYRKSIFGMLWTLLIPAGSAAIYYLVFQYVLNVKIPHYLLFVTSGIVPWSFFGSTVSTCLEVIVGNYALLNKVKLPPHALVFAEVITNLLNLLLSLPIIFVILLLSHVEVGWPALQYPVLLFVLFLTTYAFSILVSIGFIYFRDLKYLVLLILQFMFYLTPVMYQTKMIPEPALPLLHLNPVGYIFSGFHQSLVSGEFLSGAQWASILGWTLISNLSAFYVLQRCRYNIVEIL